MYVLSTLARLTWLDEGWSWGWTLGVLAWALLLAGFGELVRVRQANLMEARAPANRDATREAGEEGCGSPESCTTSSPITCR